MKFVEGYGYGKEGVRVRSGSYALSLLSVPLNVHVLEALGEGPKSLMDLRRAIGSPPQTTMRAQLRTLTAGGILRRYRQREFPGRVDYDLERPGRELLCLMRMLERWLSAAPSGPISIASLAAKSSIKALVGGWDSTVIRALAARPLSLTELNKVIGALNYPALERRLEALRLAELIEARPGRNRSVPYRASRWLRDAVPLLAAAARWEQDHVSSQVPPIGRLDVESALLLAIPMISLPGDLSGSCRMGIELRSVHGDRTVAGVVVGIEEGRVSSCLSRLQGDATAWMSGTPADWIEAVATLSIDGMEIGGDQDLAEGVIGGLHAALSPSARDLQAATAARIP